MGVFARIWGSLKIYREKEKKARKEREKRKRVKEDEFKRYSTQQKESRKLIWGNYQRIIIWKQNPTKLNKKTESSNRKTFTDVWAGPALVEMPWPQGGHSDTKFELLRFYLVNVKHFSTSFPSSDLGDFSFSRINQRPNWARTSLQGESKPAYFLSWISQSHQNLMRDFFYMRTKSPSEGWSSGGVELCWRWC